MRRWHDIEQGTVTASVQARVLRTRPVTQCVTCDGQIGDRLINLGAWLFLTEGGHYFRTLIHHPDCYAEQDDPRGRPPYPDDDPRWRECPWCERKWDNPRRRGQTRTETAYCTDACRKAARRETVRVWHRTPQCDVCKEPITTGRTDRRYCTPACRQFAYRTRKQGGTLKRL